MSRASRIRAEPAIRCSQIAAPPRPSPELFRDGLRGGQRTTTDQDDSQAVPGGTYVAPEYAPKKPAVLDRLNPFGRRQ